jgi:hypothetical protein
MKSNHEQPLKSFRIHLELSAPAKRLDTVLLEALRQQDEHLELKHISRIQFKELFKNGICFLGDVK